KPRSHSSKSAKKTRSPKTLKKEIFFQMQQDGGGRPQLCSLGETLLHIPQCTRLSGIQRVWVAKFPKEEGNKTEERTD
uniref:Uncharacterized protein n=1 Tax=Xiphophorus couchianus TaxID=32473 RepID=A0A3B5M303_9TELE